jgi:GDPmannose 4,6-dehydratase
MTQRRALITGVAGQAGAALSELLLSEGYKVFGLVRRTSKPQPVVEGVQVIYGDLTDQGSLNRAVLESSPSEVYNLGAQSFVGGSWAFPVSTADITGVGAIRMLEALRLCNPHARYFQASSSEMLGNHSGIANEQTPFAPRSPYGVAKLMAHYATINYRESYDMFACAGILMNYEGPRRGVEFVTRKITKAVARIHLGLQDKIRLGNLEAKRDWGHARDAVRSMYLMLQQDEPKEYVIATGVTRSIREFLDAAFAEVDIYDWEPLVVVDPQFYRPAEIDALCGDASLAKKELGWEPTISFEELVHEMVVSDLKIEGKNK